MPVNQAMLFGGGTILDLFLDNLSSTRTTLNGGTAIATITFDSDGTVDYHNSANVITWLTSGVASDAEVRFDPSSGSVSGGTVNMWIQLSSDVVWSVVQSTLGTKTCTGTIRLRNRVTLVEEPSKTMTLTANCTDETGGP